MQALSLVSLPPPQDLEQELHEPHSAHLHSAVDGGEYGHRLERWSNCVTQLYTKDKLSSTLFCCLSVRDLDLSLSSLFQDNKN